VLSPYLSIAGRAKPAFILRQCFRIYRRNKAFDVIGTVAMPITQDYIIILRRKIRKNKIKTLVKLLFRKKVNQYISKIDPNYTNKLRIQSSV
jgi:hypothetical protein